MKNVVMLLVSGMLGVLTLAFVMTICGKMNRSVEMQCNMSSALEMTVERMVAKEGNSLYTDETAVAECMESMADSMDTDSDVSVRVYQADTDKGILAMKFIEKFYHPNGMAGETEWERVSIYNRLEEAEKCYYEIRFYEKKEDLSGEENCYKSYMVQEGAYVTAPAVPVMQGAVFMGWKDVNDETADFSQPIEQSCSYYAEWK